MSQVSGDEFFLLAAAVNLSLETIKGGAKRGVSGWTSGHDLGEFWAQQPCVRAGDEESNAQSCRSNVIAMAFRDALDEPVQTKAAQVVGHPTDGVVGWVETQQLSQQGSHFLIGEAPQLEAEQDQHAEQCLYTPIAEL